ncbi:MFS general substrate transporter [Ascobolus immersus RN42]|uniref:MFS general substrate transporter n=1 Tax=Ascobolus immersus RN42 TaxID=1160509 RepID=A0A3N4IH51_ASCIM|nr:MFS general substrate transporter [Ascobolus immersus RN42]
MPSATETPNLERTLLQKTDRYLLPLLSLLFLLNSLDRSNIGNAESGGFSRDTGIPPSAINTSVSYFFAVFVLFQPLGAALGRRYGARRWIPFVMVGWGIGTLLMVWVRTAGQLIAVRTMIGLLEAGFYPTAVGYLSTFYTRYEFGQRLALFYGQYAVAGAVGGALSSMVFWIWPPTEAGSRTEGWKAWEILFVVQGLGTLITAGVAAWWLPKGPGDAWWLTGVEQELAQDRVEKDRTIDGQDLTDTADPETPDDDNHDREEDGLISSSSNRRSIETKAPPLTKEDILETLIDWKIYWILFVNILSSLPTIAFSIFLPLVLHGLSPKSSPAFTNLLAVPPFILGAIVLYLTTLRSDRDKQRLRYVLFALTLTLVGLFSTWVLTLSAVATGSTLIQFLRYLALCILLSGSFTASPLTVAWLSSNITSPSKRTLALGINGWGNFAGVLAPVIFDPKYAPDYSYPFAVTMVLVGVATVGYAGFWKVLLEENRWRVRVVETWRRSSEWEEERERREGDGRVPKSLRKGWWWEGTGVRVGERRLVARYGY